MSEHVRYDDHQCTYIDLPGETVQCYRTHDHLKVVLKKHRDVIFDLNLKAGTTYSIESDVSDFYCPKANKLYSRGKPITFKDGEKFHIWVGREFIGRLILKQSGKVIAKYELPQLDKTKYDNDPKTKPAPFIVTIGKSNQTPSPQAKTTLANQKSLPTLAQYQTSFLKQHPTDNNFIAQSFISPSFGASAQNNWTKWYIPPATVSEPQSVHVFEVNHDFPAPQEIADFFEKGGEETAIDTVTKQFTRNWLWAQIGGTLAYYNDNKHWVDELFKQKFYLQKVVHKKAGVKWYINFKGNPALRKFITGTRYAVGNTKVLGISMGVGSVDAMKNAGKEALKGAKSGAAKLAFFLTIALDTAEWVNDYQTIDPVTGKHKRDLFDLAGKIITDLAKAGVSAVLGTAVMAGVVGLAPLVSTAASALVGAVVTVSFPVSVVVIGAVVVAIAIGLALDWLDNHYHITESLGLGLRSIGNFLENNMTVDYKGFQSYMNRMAEYSY